MLILQTAKSQLIFYDFFFVMRMPIRGHMSGYIFVSVQVCKKERGKGRKKEKVCVNMNVCVYNQLYSAYGRDSSKAKPYPSFFIRT